MSSTLTPFTLYGGFRSNPFTSSVVSAGGNPFQGQSVPMQGHFSSQGTSLGGTPLQGQWNPTQGMSQGGNPFPGQFNPMPGVFPAQGGSTGGNPDFPFRNQMGGGFPPFNQGQQGFIPIPGPSMNSFWKPGASYNPGSSFQAANQSSRSLGYHFWKHCIFQTYPS
jgi:hypothetical protein